MLIAIIVISSIVVAIIGIVVLYFIIKAAVRNGTLEAYDRIQLIGKKISNEEEPLKEDECPVCFSKLENGICVNCDYTETKNNKPV